MQMKDRAQVEEKIKKLIADGAEKLQIITDFDRTLSKQHHNGELTKSSYCMFIGIIFSFIKSNFVILSGLYFVFYNMDI